MQLGNGSITSDIEWSTKWRALSRCNIVSSVWPTVRCHQAVTRTTTGRPIRRANSTRTTLRWSPAQPTWSPTTPGVGRDPTSATSSKRHRMPETRLTLMTMCTEYIIIIRTVHLTLKMNAVASLGGRPPRVTPYRGWHPNKSIFVAKFRKNTG